MATVLASMSQACPKTDGPEQLGRMSPSAAPVMTCGDAKWAWQVLNLRPLPCEGSALPLSYTPQGVSAVYGGVGVGRNRALPR
jgi:hypothetical protein